MRRRLIQAIALALATTLPAVAWDVDGLLDARLVHSNTSDSWTDGGLGKQRYDSDHEGLRLGQGLLTISGNPLDTVQAEATLSADDRRHHVLDINEGFLRWRPIPTSSWRMEAKAGAFFAPFSLENDGTGWSTTRTLSASAINSWFGEEFRTKGVELQISRPGRFVQSAHDFGLTVAAYRGNEPAGSLLAYRGWSVGDRITGLTETVPLSTVPIYGAYGSLDQDDKKLDDFHQIDSRTGYYAMLHYAYSGWVSLDGYHYDNNANPAAWAHYQWAWHTRFDGLNLKITPADGWEVLAQGLRGSTEWNSQPARMDYRAGYVLADYRWDENLIAARYDRFKTWRPGFAPSFFFSDDYFSESGHAWTVSYTHELREGLNLTAEWLRVHSDRPAREFLNQPETQTEQSATIALRWAF
jgi:hypothetical protein